MNIPTSPFSDQEINSLVQNMLNNISSATNCLTMVNKNITILAKAGAVIASPSMPDNQFSQSYYYHWVRDGAIVMSSVCSLYENCHDAEKKSFYRELIINYLDFVETIQSQPIKNNVNVLGEPKFNVDGTVWDEPWGRPQVGGACCQALVLAKILRIFLKEKDSKDIVHKIYNHNFDSLLKANLEYCAKTWSEDSFNVWEELNGKHLSVNILQHTALLVGSLIAVRFLDPKAAFYYKEMANHITGVMRSHWKESLGYYFETLNAENALGGGIDSSILMALCNIQACPIIDDEFLLTSYRSLGTIFYIRNAFENLYKINVEHKMRGGKGLLIGRYVQDIYDGNQSIYGNPWFLCSAMLASAYYLLAHQLLDDKKILVNSLVMQFLSQITTLKFTENENIDKHHPHFFSLIHALLEEGDAILALIKKYSLTYPDGSSMHLSEQIDRSTGLQVSARDLSWSYAAVLSALEERNKLVALLSQ